MDQQQQTQGNLAGFDANQVEPNEGFELLPAGKYPVVIVKSETQATKDNTGQFLYLEMQVTSGQYQNQKVFDRLNLWNPSTKAVQIAKGTLSAICRAVGVMTPNDSTELHMKPMIVTVKVDPAKDGYGPSNSVTKYEPYQQQQAGQAPQQAPQGHVPQQQPQGQRPW